MLPLHIIDQSFPQPAAQIPCAARVSGADQYPQLDRTFPRFDHLGQAQASVPFRRCFAQPLGFAAQQADRHPVIDPDGDCAEDL